MDIQNIDEQLILNTTFYFESQESSPGNEQYFLLF